MTNATDVLPLLVGVLLVACAAAFALMPLVGGMRGAELAPADASGDGAQERQALYRQVVELEFDHQTGKLATADFRSLEAELLQQAAANLREQGDQVDDDDIDSEVEREIAAARAAFAAARSARSVVAAAPERRG